MIEIRIYADEAVLNLERLPRRVKGALRAKMEQIIPELRQELFRGLPGKFFDPDFIRQGVQAQGNLVIGFIESEDKPGVYSILPTKGRALRFISKSGEVVYTPAVYRHPFLKSSPRVARLLAESKSWIIDQLEDAFIEAL